MKGQAHHWAQVGPRPGPDPNSKRTRLRVAAGWVVVAGGIGKSSIVLMSPEEYASRHKAEKVAS